MGALSGSGEPRGQPPLWYMDAFCSSGARFISTKLSIRRQAGRVGKGYNEYISNGILCEVCLHLPPNEASGVLATETMHCWRLTGGMDFDWDNGSPDPDIGRFQCALDGPRRCSASGVTPSLSRLTMGCGCS